MPAGRKSHHGYRLTVNVDVRHKFIRKIQTSTASEHDSRYLESVLDRATTSADVYAGNRRDSAIKLTSGRTSSLCHDVRKAIGEGGCGMSGLFEVPTCIARHAQPGAGPHRGEDRRIASGDNYLDMRRPEAGIKR